MIVFIEGGLKSLWYKSNQRLGPAPQELSSCCRIARACLYVSSPCKGKWVEVSLYVDGHQAFSSPRESRSHSTPGGQWIFKVQYPHQVRLYSTSVIMRLHSGRILQWYQSDTSGDGPVEDGG